MLLELEDMYGVKTMLVDPVVKVVQNPVYGNKSPAICWYTLRQGIYIFRCCFSGILKLNIPLSKSRHPSTLRLLRPSR